MIQTHHCTMRSMIWITGNGLKKAPLFLKMDYDSDPFEQLGKDFETEKEITVGIIGMADCRLVEQRKIVDYARDWLKAYHN